ncbi:MAG: hypothetical protein LBL05_05545, partial [Synergistaceae bacterium]|nr:hypothetical protein [Synergistaceae bacterium]
PPKSPGYEEKVTALPSGARQTASKNALMRGVPIRAKLPPKKQNSAGVFCAAAASATVSGVTRPPASRVIAFWSQ